MLHCVLIYLLLLEGGIHYTTLTGSTATKMDYHLSLCYPSDMEEAAMEMDRILLSMVQKATGLVPPWCTKAWEWSTAPDHQ